VVDNEGNLVEGASISLNDSEGNKVELLDIGDGKYKGRYSVPLDFPVGTHAFSFIALKVDSSGSGLVGFEELVRDVGIGKITAVLVEPFEPKALVGEKLLLKFRLVYASGLPALNADVNASLNNVSIPLSSDGNAVFSGSYLFSEADIEKAFLVISAVDNFGNSGETSIEFSVQQPLPLIFVLLLIALIAAILLALYGFKRTHRLSKLLHKMSVIKVSTRKAMLQKAIARETSQKKKLAKKIAAQQKELAKVMEEIEIERRKQALAVQRMPAESGYAVHRTAIGLKAKLKRLFSRRPKKSPEQLETEARIIEIDAETEKLRAQIRNLESEYCKQTIKEDFFRKKLFEYREKVHLLELEKKKIE